MTEKKLSIPVEVFFPPQTLGLPRWFFWTAATLLLAGEAILISLNLLIFGVFYGLAIIAVGLYARKKTLEDRDWLQIRLVHFRLHRFNRGPYIYQPSKRIE